VVSDVGGGRDGSGDDPGPAAGVVAEIEATGGQAVPSYHDVSSWEGAAGLVGAALEAYGRLDVVVNNAGILRDRMLTSMSEAEWDDVVRVHMKSTFCMTRHAADHWRQQSKAGAAVDARVINTTSSSGLYGNVGQSNYGAAKAGIAAFTVITAEELGRYGVTVNAVSPGALTRMTADLPLDDALKQRWDPAWVSPVVAWLASTRSGDVSGQVFEASGLGLGVAEGWHRGPTAAAVAEPEDVEAVLRPLLAAARPAQRQA
jgi:NAD(P)-dependent dehydrogenase (short-subunit alcohol dehydrogenase family)